MSDVEDDAEMKEMTEEEIAKKNNWPRCSKCKRYMFMHEPGRGSNCKMEMMNDEDLESHDRMILLKRLEKAKEAGNVKSVNVQTGSVLT